MKKQAARPQPKIRKSTTFVLGEGVNDLHTPIGESQTVPDMAMSLQTILDRHTRGLEIPTFTPQYSEDEFPNFKQLDLTELDEYKEYAKNRVQELQSGIKQADEIKRKKAAEQAQKPVAVLDANTPPAPTQADKPTA